MSETSLAIFSRGSQLLAEANTIQKAKDLKDLALTAADWARRKGMGEEAVQYARSYALDAERKMGQMLIEAPKAKGTQGQLRGDVPKGARVGGDKSELPTKPQPPTLHALGLTKRDSSQAQKMARLSEEKFQAVKSGTITTRADCTVRRDTAMRAAASVWDFAQFCARSVRAPWCIVAILAAIIARCDRRGRPGATGRGDSAGIAGFSA